MTTEAERDGPETARHMHGDLLNVLKYVYERRAHDCSTMCATEPMCEWWMVSQAIRRHTANMPTNAHVDALQEIRAICSDKNRRRSNTAEPNTYDRIWGIANSAIYDLPILKELADRIGQSERDQQEREPR